MKPYGYLFVVFVGRFQAGFFLQKETVADEKRKQ
jgi:hypothetical protein